jgi:hypothetical protein
VFSGDVCQTGNRSFNDGSMTEGTTMKPAPVAESWDALIERFDKFVSMPCLLGSGLTQTAERPSFARKSATS